MVSLHHEVFDAMHGRFAQVVESGLNSLGAHATENFGENLPKNSNIWIVGVRCQSL